LFTLIIVTDNIKAQQLISLSDPINKVRSKLRTKFATPGHRPQRDSIVTKT